MAFTNVVMRITYKDNVLTVQLKDKKLNEDFHDCFQMQNNIDLSYEKFFFVSAMSGMAVNNHHYIYSIKTTDLDQQVDRVTYERQI